MSIAADLGVRLTTTESPVGLTVDDLVTVALRRNPRRAHLLVSSVLGKHVAVSPRTSLDTGHALGQLVSDVVGRRPTDAPIPTLSRQPDGQLRADEPIAVAATPAATSTVDAWRGADGPLVIGYAETATALGHHVADALGARCYLHSTRRPEPSVAPSATFEEGHSHATTHLLLPVPAQRLAGDDPVVLVDDEFSTGSTAMATIDALQPMLGRTRWVIAALVDLRSAEDRQRMAAWAADAGLQVDVTALASGTVDLPAGLAAAAAEHIAAKGVPATEQAIGPVARLVPRWPAGMRQGGRFGFCGGARPAFDTAVAGLAGQVDDELARWGWQSGRALVVGTEELMYLPQRLAAAMDRSERPVFVQSTTRSPVHVEQSAGYPIRRVVCFEADSSAAGEPARFAYNLTVPDHTGRPVDPDVIILVTDDLPGGVVDAVARLGIPVLVVSMPAERPRPEPLHGPAFGSYPPAEVSWLLTDLSAADLERPTAEREALAQAGLAHYAESLPVEFQPSAEYQELYRQVLAQSAGRLATAIGVVTELCLRERGEDLVLTSLARAGTPIGILMKRWAAFRHGLDLPHYAVSIVRDRGIDVAALEYLAAHHDPASVLFVDGWTGKGAITVELSQALQALAAGGGPLFSPEIAVLADPGSCTPLYGTREDFLIASAALNSTVSGLVSRTVLNQELLTPDQFHGAKFYAELSPVDVSNDFVATVAGQFTAESVDAALPALLNADRRPTFAGWRAIEVIQAEYGLPSINLVKPGVGETTRVLLRRIPWKVLLRTADSPDHAHIRLLAVERQVPVEIRPDLPYACVGIIRPLSGDE